VRLVVATVEPGGRERERERGEEEKNECLYRREKDQWLLLMSD